MSFEPHHGQTRRAGTSFTSQPPGRQTVRESARRTPRTLRAKRACIPSFIQTVIRVIEDHPYNDGSCAGDMRGGDAARRPSDKGDAGAGFRARRLVNSCVVQDV